MLGCILTRSAHDQALLISARVKNLGHALKGNEREHRNSDEVELNWHRRSDRKHAARLLSEVQEGKGDGETWTESRQEVATRGTGGQRALKDEESGGGRHVAVVGEHVPTVLESLARQTKSCLDRLQDLASS